VAWAGRRTLPWAVAAAVTIGLMNLQRPTGLFMGLPLAAYALLRIAGPAAAGSTPPF